MGDESLYKSVLKDLNDIISGSADFEKIGYILMEFLHPEYNFKKPEGGQGTKDGGYDGRDLIRKAKLACSIDKNYTAKIQMEIEKSLKNGDKQLFYLSNQKIPEVIKNKFYSNNDNTGIELFISGIDELSRELDNYFFNHYNPELYDLLHLSFLKVGEYYRRGDAKPFDNIYNCNIYKKKIVIIDRRIYYNYNKNAEAKISENPLLEHILTQCSERQSNYFDHIILSGIGCLGKSFLMKITYNTLIEEFSNKSNYSQYQFIPFVQFLELKYYYPSIIGNKVKNDIDPFLFFLDGIDELNESKKIDLNNELQTIISNNKRVHFIIAGRNSSFSYLDILHNSIQLHLEKFIDFDDEELMNLIYDYRGTPIADLLSIPTYRNFVLEKRISKNARLDEFYTLLVQNSLMKDKERNDYSNQITPRKNSEININDIILALSEFCYKLFMDGKNVFTENELKEYFINENHYIFILYSSIIDYQDKNNISFISSSYYEYFISIALSTKDKKTVLQIFFSRGKIRIPLIDILIQFLNYSKTKSKELYICIKKNMLKDNIACILLCEFDSILNYERYNYFKSIFRKYKKEKWLIYYGRFHQSYGPLKNIDNMAQQMQQLLTNSYKLKAINFLKNEIMNYLLNPTKNDVYSFGNAVILLLPSFIKDLWLKEEQKVLKDIALPIIKFFLFNDLSNELNALLSEKFIFDWYEVFNWTIGWEQRDWELFYEDIAGCTCNLLSEITDDNDFTIKFNIFSIFYNDACIKSLLFPIARYAMKNIYPKGYGMASFVSDEITDENETPMIKTDDRTYILSHLLENMDLNTSNILDLLIFAQENDLYESLKDTHESIIIILEDKLYNNIFSLNTIDYKIFSDYYFSVEKHGFNDRLFQSAQTEQLDNLKDFLVKEVIQKEVIKLGVGHFLHNLINLTNKEHSFMLLCLIKEKLSQNIYKDTVYYVYNNTNHILNKAEYTIREYNTLFKEEIQKETEREKKLEKIKKEMETVKNNDISLILNQDAMIIELHRINAFLISQPKEEKYKTDYGKIYELKHESILRMFPYDYPNCEAPIFSESAIGIMEDFYRDNIINIDIIIKELKEGLFKDEFFYLYFYWFYIRKTQNIDNSDLQKVTANPDLVQKIIESMNNDVYEKFAKKPQEYFEYNHYQWLIPFFYYYENLLNNVPPAWMQLDHILKLIVTPEPSKERTVRISTDVSLNWLIDKFPIIKPNQIVEQGLKIIESVKDPFSRLQIAKYLLDYYASNEQNILTDKIMDFIIITTKKLFEIKEIMHKYLEFQYIGLFWTKCNSNYIDRLFPKLTISDITSTIKRSDKNADYQYRKYVLLYCSVNATNEQKIRMINEIKNDFKDTLLSDRETDEIHSFLASLGVEDSIRFIIKSYINGKSIHSRFSFNNYPLGFMNQSNSLLNDFIDLFLYSNAKSTERRSIIFNIAQDGIKQHLNKENFKILEKRLIKEIKKLNEKSSWKSEYFNEFLLQMEQLVYP
jgi:hypothetical protein